MSHHIISEKLAQAKAECERLEMIGEKWQSSLKILSKTYEDIYKIDTQLGEQYKQEILNCLNVTKEVSEVEVSAPVLTSVSNDPIKPKNNVVALIPDNSEQQSEENPNYEDEPGIYLPPLKQQFGSDSNIKFNAAIGLDTVMSKAQGKIVNDYPITIGRRVYASAWSAIQEELIDDYLLSDDLLRPITESKDYQLVKTVVLAKLEQYPNLVTALTNSGGVSWIEDCSYFEDNPNIDEHWQGIGMKSGFIRALIEAYEEKTQIEPPVEENNDEAQYLIMSPYVFYEPSSRILKIGFSDFSLASKWGDFLKKSFACESYSLEAESVAEPQFSRILKAEQVTEDTVNYLVKNANFKQEPGDNNPLALQPEVELTA